MRMKKIMKKITPLKNDLYTKGIIAVIGAIGIDTNVWLPATSIDYSVEANFTSNYDYIGQAGGYVSRGYQQLGYPTAFFGHVGKDYHGDFIKQILKRDGIDISYIEIDPVGTKRSVNFMYPNGQRKNFYDGKGHMEIVPNLAKAEQLFHKSSFAHFNLMNWSRQLLPIAAKQNIPILVDLQDVVTAEDPYRLDFIRMADIICLSAVNFPDPRDLIQQILKQNSKSHLLILIGLGKKGCALANRQIIRYWSAIDLPNHPVIDTNGAGDGLAIGFASSFLIEGYDIPSSILRGEIYARYTCGIKASTDHLLNKPKLTQYFEKLHQEFHVHHIVKI